MAPSVDSGSVFVGRRGELKTVLDAAERARGGTATTALIVGEAGVGKSRLLREYLKSTRIGRAAAGDCLDLGGGGLPFAPFVTALRSLVRELRSDDPAALEDLWELRRLLPELGPPAESIDDGRARLFEEVLVLLERAAEPHGLAVVVEDAHWADRSTRDLLVFLLHNLGSARVQLLISCRSDELHRNHPMRALLPELSRLPEVTRVDLPPLTRDEVAAQAADLRGGELDAATVDLVYARSGGNPLFVESFLEGGEGGELRFGSVPEAPKELLLRWVRALDDTGRGVVKAAAVAGERVGHDLLARIADLPEPELEAALRAAIDANVLRVEGSAYVFRHALLAEAAYEALLPSERVRLHRACADALESGAGGLPPGRVAARLAHHRYAAHDLPRALSAAWDAAQAAGAALAYPEKLRMLERVLELWEQVPDAPERVGGDHVRMLLLAANSATHVGDPARGAALATEGLDELTGGILTGMRAEQVPELDAVRIAQLLHVRGNAYKEDAQERGLDDLRDALRILPPGNEERPQLMATLADDLMQRREFDEALAAGEEALKLARAADDRHTEARVLGILGRFYGIDRGQAETGLEMLRRSRELTREHNWPLSELRAVHNTGLVLRFNGRGTEALENYWAGARRERELRLPGNQMLGVVATLRDLGRLEEAERYAAEAARAVRSARRRGTLAHVRAVVAYERGDIAAARGHWQHAFQVLPEETTLESHVAPREVGEVLVYKAEGHWGEARQHIERLLGSPLVDPSRDLVHAWDVLEVGAEVWHEAVRAPSAPEPERWTDFRQRLLDIAAGRVATGPRVVAMRDSAYALLCEEPEEAIGQFDRLAELWRDLQRPVPQARALLFAAEAAGEHGNPAEAASRLAEGRAICAATGAGQLLRAAEELSARFGIARDGAAQNRLPVGLTPREAEVLRLVAAGRTNREVAEHLSIAPKTASVHVSNLLAKLKVPNRSAAAAKAAELGLGGAAATGSAGSAPARKP